MKKAFISLSSVLIIVVLLATSVYASVNKMFGRESNRIPLIVIDAGHGGFDGGCIGIDGSYEKDINLEISLKLNDLLQSLGFKTLLIRSKDVSVETTGSSIREKKKSDIKNRFSYMSQNPGCVYLSVHQNQYSAASVKGAQMFYTPDNDKSKLLAQYIQHNIASNVQKANNRKIKPCTKDVYIIHYAPIESTAVLIECGFLSNYSDLQNLKNSDYQNRMCSAISFGVLDWLKDAS